MGLLSPQKLDEVIAAGCACGAKRLAFRTYVDAWLPLMEAEPVGRIHWAYDGEAFCDGVFEVSCAACKAVLFESAACPRCHADGGLAKALEAENGYPVPERCPRCENIEVAYWAMVPAITHYEGKRADKAKCESDLLDPGFHGYKVACKACGVVAELTKACPLCDAPAPLRPRA